MKAIVYRTYGGPEVLRVEDRDIPVPADEQLLLRVRAASVNPYDWHFMRGSPSVMRLMTGLTKPKDIRLGVDVAGIVEAVGSKVTQFRVGDAVFGGSRGAFAEYTCAAATSVTTKPDTVTFEEAAAAPMAGLTALCGLRDRGKIEPSRHVLINGAAGGVGTFAVQIAKALGAHVTGVCSTRNVELVRSLGADAVIDYTREDFTDRPERYDIVLDCHVTHPLRVCARVLTPDGDYIIVGAPGRGFFCPLSVVVKAIGLSPFTKHKIGMMMANGTPAHLALIAELMRTGKVKTMIDRRYALRNVPDAIRYVEEGHVRGKVVITIA